MLIIPVFMPQNNDDDDDDFDFAPPTLKDFLKIMSWVVLLLYLAMTFVFWVLDYDERTLVELLITQWHWISSRPAAIWGALKSLGGRII